jgi:hypothetical protein
LMLLSLRLICSSEAAVTTREMLDYRRNVSWGMLHKSGSFYFIKSWVQVTKPQWMVLLACTQDQRTIGCPFKNVASWLPHYLIG